MDILHEKVQGLIPDRFEMKYAKEFRDSRLVGEVSEEELALLKLCMPEVKFNVKVYGAL